MASANPLRRAVGRLAVQLHGATPALPKRGVESGPGIRGLSTAAKSSTASRSRVAAAAALLTRGSPVGSSWDLGPVASLLRAPSSRGFASLPSFDEIGMPALSPTMETGNLSAWKVKVGDEVAPGVILAEIETDKASIEWEAQEEGYVASLLVPEGAQDVPIGAPVLVLVDEAEDVAKMAGYTPGAAPAAAAAPPPPPTPTPAAPVSSGKSWPAHEVLGMPALSPTMDAGNIVSWNKQVGEEVIAGETICEVETDKATLGWEAQGEEGFVAAQLVEAGTSDIKVGSPVLVLVEDEADVAAFADFTLADAATLAPAATAPAAPAPAPAPATPPPAPAAPAPTAAVPAAKMVAGDDKRVIASPYAKKLAREAGVTLAGVAGSGPGGRIIAVDVQELIKSGGAVASTMPAVTTSASEGDFVDVVNSQIRKVTAARLAESKATVPHYYLSVECEIDEMMATRKALNDTLVSIGGGGKLSVNDFVLKAAAMALRAVPEVNAAWHGDFIRQYNYVDISVAVQTPIGLMVPIVKDADAKGLGEIAAEVKSLAGKAKEGKLTPAEFTGGTFTISNLGMYGIKDFAAIVNPPQAAILAVGGSSPKLVLRDGTVKEVNVMTVTLSCDHRVVDGAVGAQWLNAFKGFIQRPSTMML